ncbi:MAG: cytochrome c [Hyphomicrobium sp.]
MNKLFGTGAGLFAALLLAGTALAQSGKGTIVQGRALLEANCARCHAIGQDGASPHETAPPFRVVVTLYPPESLAEALAEGIVSGHPDMPEFVFMSPEIEAIIAYLGSLKPAPDVSPQKD